MKTVGKALQLAGGVGLISPWLPDPGNSAASDDLTGWALVGWLAVCVALVAIGGLFIDPPKFLRRHRTPRPLVADDHTDNTHQAHERTTE